MLAWARLLNLELTLAQHNLHRLLIGAIAAAVHIYTDSWLAALASGIVVQVTCG